MTLAAQVVPTTIRPAGGWRPSRWRWYLAALFALLCGVHFGWSGGLFGEVTYCAVTLGAGVAGWVGVCRRAKGHRFLWMCVALGVTLSGVADVIFSTITHIEGSPPVFSMALPFWLLAYVALGVGLLALLVRRDDRRLVDVDGFIDLGSYVVMALIVVSQVAGLGDLFATSRFSLAAKLNWAAYPILDAALLAVLVRAMVSRRLHGSAGVLMSVGIGCWLASDFATLIIADPTVLSSWMDLGWMAGSVTMGLSAWRSGRAVHDEPSPATVTGQVTGARVFIGLAPLAVPGLLETVAFATGRNTNPVPLFVASVALILLAFFRARRLLGLRDRQQAELEIGRRYYQALADNSAEAVVVLDSNDVIMNDAPGLARLLGYRGKTTGCDLVGLLEPLDRGEVMALLERMRHADAVVHADVRLRDHAGVDRWFAARAIDLTSDLAVRGLVLNLHDVTDRKHAQDELTRRAFHDSLTGLANRALFHDRVEHALQRTARTAADIAVVYLDVDGFKTVNDSRGHESGDDVLREIATRLQAAVRTADTVARLGGDEFAILIEQSAHALDEAGTVADRILQSLTTPIRLGDQHTVLSASIGITVSDPEATASSMLRNADVAMFRAKTTGKGRWAVYDPQMRTAAVQRLALETDLVTALDNHEFRLLYQPIIELDTGQVVGFEALLRWEHPTRGLVGPDAFVPIAEDNGSIIEIGRWVLLEACRTAATWQDLYPQRRLTMAVNLSTRQIATPDVVDHVVQALARSGFEPEQLVLEMTESVLVEDTATAAQRLHQLHALDVRLAIDDFGTGYSSLSYLRQFPVDILKIDRSFTSTITDPDRVPAIVRGLVDLGKTLQLEIIAEGIEDTVQRDALRDLRCQYGQGYLFAKPLTATAGGELLARVLERHTTPLS